MLLTNFPSAGLVSIANNGLVLPPGAKTQHARRNCSRDSDAIHPLQFYGLLALARLRGPGFGTDAGPRGGFLAKPNSQLLLLSTMYTYRLISRKEPMYKQQLHVFKFPFVQFKINMYTLRLSTVL